MSKYPDVDISGIDSGNDDNTAGKNLADQWREEMDVQPTKSNNLTTSAEFKRAEDHGTE